jgi:hydrogenase nickel incorporation protein HypA/HybF
MHELSIVQSIVDIASKAAVQAHSQKVESIELDIGDLSGIEMDAFWFAWKLAVPDTILSGAKTVVHAIAGEAKCLVCDTDFPVKYFHDPCPACNSHMSDIVHGKELRVKAITVC